MADLNLPHRLPTLDELARKRWIATHILPLEGQARRWLMQRVRRLSRTEVDDLIQEAFYRLWMTDLSTILAPGAYFYIILRNLLLQKSRHSKIVPMERMGDIDELSIPRDELGPDRRIAARQELERVSRLVDALPDQCRRVFELRKLHGLSQREVAEQLGISERTVEKHLAKALSRVTRREGSGKHHAGTEPHPDVSSEKTDDGRHEHD